MVKGKDHYERAEKSETKILNVLKDDQEHRYRDLLDKTKVSPTTLTKHLEHLSKTGMVEKRMDLKSAEYPHPVYYKLKKESAELISFMNSRVASVEEAKKILFNKGPSAFFEDLNNFAKQTFLATALILQASEEANEDNEKIVNLSEEDVASLIELTIIGPFRDYANVFINAAKAKQINLDDFYKQLQA